MLRLLEELSERCKGRKLPDNYVVIDTETSGVNLYDDRVLQLGMCFVRNRTVSFSICQLLNRPDIKIHPKAQEVHGITHEKMASEGVLPRLYIPEFVKMLTWARENGYMFAGHNMVAFDAPLLESEMLSLGCPFKFGENEIIDTGMLVKAAQLGMFFRAGEPMRSFYKRTAEHKVKGVHWSLDRYCYNRYDLKKHGCDISKAHNAEADAIMSHCLFEELRRIGEKEKQAHEGYKGHEEVETDQKEQVAEKA